MTKKKKRGLMAATILLLVLGIALAVWLASCEPGTPPDESSETTVSHDVTISYTSFPPPEDDTSAVSSDPSDDIPSEESPPDESEYSDEEPYDPPSADSTETSGGSESFGETPTPPDTSEEEPDTSDTSDTSEPEGPPDVSDVSSETPACPHEWGEATCTSAKTCATCGKTEGSAKGHDWKSATCTAPKTCKTCGKTDGVAAGHNWEGATCTSAKTCKSCGVNEGSAKGHDWADATCTSAKTCESCGKTDGSAKGHSYSKGTCTACGAKDPDYKEAAVHGDTPVVIEVNGVEYTLTSYADAEAVLPMKTEADFVSPEKGFTIYVKSGAVMAGTTYTANGDGTYTGKGASGTTGTMSDNQVTNVFRNFWCKTCGARKGDGTHGTCVRYLHDDECDECGEAVKALECHTCKEN